MDPEVMREFFDQKDVVEHYAKATNGVGLWNSEEKIFTRLFDKQDSLLELGCGTGRITIGMWELGYKNIMAIDFAKGMVREAKRIARILEYGLSFQVGDARNLKFEDNTFEGAIFGFNGLMQIPGHENRKRAMKEIFRVIRPGAYFTFTAHDREVHWNKNYWRAETKSWNSGKQHPELSDFGDTYYDSPEGGMMFIHSPTSQEVRRDLKEAGFRVESDCLRSQISPESDRVRDFSDDCRFWIAQKPIEAAQGSSDTEA